MSGLQGHPHPQGQGSGRETAAWRSLLEASQPRGCHLLAPSDFIAASLSGPGAERTREARSKQGDRTAQSWRLHSRWIPGVAAAPSTTADILLYFSLSGPCSHGHQRLQPGRCSGSPSSTLAVQLLWSFHRDPEATDPRGSEVRPGKP